MREFIERWLAKKNAAGNPLADYSALQTRTHQITSTLVQSANPGAKRQYIAISDSQIAEQLFQRLKNDVAQLIKRQRRLHEPPPYLLQAGRLGRQGQYFYLQPWNAAGWLFDLNPRGWLICRAELNKATNTFLRERDAWDFCNLLQPDEGQGLLRLSSTRYGREMVSYQIYKEFLIAELGLEAPRQPAF